MSICRTFSEIGRAAGGIRWILLVAGVFLAWQPRMAASQEVVTQEEALRLAFPGATTIERRTAFLDDRQLAAARRGAGSGVEVKPGVVVHYVARRGDQPLGVAYFDAHRVRTLPEVLMIVVSPRGAVDRIEILRFSEPPEYRAPERWLELFEGEALTEQLAVRRGIPNITGASLTSRAVTEAVRRVLALHRAIDPIGSQRVAGSR